MTYSDQLDIRVTDTSLRDGSHAKRHQFTEEHVRSIVAALDDAGMPVIEVTHGDGLGGSSYNYGFSKTDERVLMKVAVETARRARIAALMLPGLGTKDDIKACADLGVSIVRVATHCTEADISIQHFGLAREIGLETVGFLMMAHSQPPEALADAGADHGRRRLPVRVRRRLGRGDGAGGRARPRVGALVAELGGDAQVGFHGHENLGPVGGQQRAGGPSRRGADRRLHPGLRRRRRQHAAGVLRRGGRAAGIRTGLDVLKMIDVAEDVVRPVMDGECVKDRLAVIMGYAGVYSSFLKHAYRAAERYDVSGADILLECGRQKLVGGQEDQIIQIAATLAGAPLSGAGVTTRRRGRRLGGRGRGAGRRDRRPGRHPPPDRGPPGPLPGGRLPDPGRRLRASGSTPGSGSSAPSSG